MTKEPMPKAGEEKIALGTQTLLPTVTNVTLPLVIGIISNSADGGKRLMLYSYNRHKCRWEMRTTKRCATQFEAEGELQLFAKEHAPMW